MEFFRIMKRELLLLIFFLGSIFLLVVLKNILVGDFFNQQQFVIFFMILFFSANIYEKEVKKIKNIKLFLLNEFYHLISISVVFTFLVIIIKLIGGDVFIISPLHLFGILFYSILIIKISKTFRYIFKLGFFVNHGFFYGFKQYFKYKFNKFSF